MVYASAGSSAVVRRRHRAVPRRSSTAVTSVTSSLSGWPSRR